MSRSELTEAADMEWQRQIKGIKVSLAIACFPQREGAGVCELHGRATMLLLPHGMLSGQPVPCLLVKKDMCGNRISLNWDGRVIVTSLIF